jgi:Dolichyl-phosphate-mannose-protein mannosyltransferase
MSSLSQRARWALIVAAGCLLLAAFHVWWIAAHRKGYPLNVDEAGYLAIGIVDYIGLRTSGPSAWWDAVQGQAPNAPLVPALASLLLLVKPGLLVAFGVLIGFLILLVLATYGIAERLAGPRLGALAALVVATSQGAFAFTREYVFALPVAALLVAAVYALLRSEGLRSRRWAVAAGVILGLMVLARTMAVAFLPGVLAAAVLLSLTSDWAELRKRGLNFALMIGAGVLTAATWYWRNLQSVLDYLTSYGYGTQSNYYGPEQSFLSWGRFRSVFDRIVFDDLLVPFAALVFCGLLALVVIVVRRVLAAEDRRQALLRLAQSDACAVAVVFAAGFGALMSSQNGGNGFTYPLAVLLPSLAVVALRGARWVAIAVAALCGIVAALNVVTNSNLSYDLSRTRLVELPVLGHQPWASGVPHTVTAIREQVDGPEAEFGRKDEEWVERNDELAELLVERVGRGVPPVTAFASKNRLISTNSVGLAGLLKYRQGMPLAQLTPEPTDSVGNYVRQFTAPEFPVATALVTMSSEAGDFPPLVTQRYAEIAARRVGFRPLRTMTLPDGRLLRVWVKPPEPEKPADRSA